MPIALQGTPSNVTTPLSTTIVSLANNGAGAIRVHTSAPHLFGQGDTVQISTSVVTGTFTIAVIDATHFDLVASTFTSTSTGTATDQSLTPAVNVPLDGDTGSLQGSGLVSFAQAVLDRTAANRLGIVALQQAGAACVAFIINANTGIPAPVAIASITANGPPCELRAVGHGLQSGMTVSISGATGDTSINGTWQVTVIDANHFTIPRQAVGGYTASTATVQWVTPAGCAAIVYEGWGGGGGGEQGAGGGTNLDSGTHAFTSPPGGGGGAGAPLTTGIMPSAAGRPLTVVPGAGGLGGSGGGPGIGATGAATTLSDGTTTVSCLGGQGAGWGHGISGTTPSQSEAMIAPGGSGYGSTGAYRRATLLTAGYYIDPVSVIANNGTFVPREPGAGGCSIRPLGGLAVLPATVSTNGFGNNGNAGNAPGSIGANSSNYLGGAGGGGGGAGPGGSGAGTGGNGTNGNVSGNSANGGAGTSASGGGTGAGGGGGGSAGAATGTTGNGGVGGAGDSGSMTVYFVRAANG